MITLKINLPFKYKGKAFKIGQLVNIEADKNGNALDKFWRSRIKDSALDNCVEKVEPKKKGK